MFYLFECFNILTTKNFETFTKVTKNDLKIKNFWGSILGLSGVFGVNQKIPKISTNAYLMKLNLRQLNSMRGTTMGLPGDC